MADDKILEEHRKTWNGFVWLIGCSTAACVLTLALMALFLT
ncbi:MAG: aa3-type cytochrome c oxidase subunit IV [Alphaproteobacteria bacterium]